MKRFHVHLNVTDLPASIRFYSQLFASEPSVLKHDYAKWMLEDPRINFAISSTGRGAGIDHLGIQVESETELAELGQRLDAAGGDIMPEAAAVCCYAESDKIWTADPQGTRWETFHTFGAATSYYTKDAACSSAGSACGTSAKSAPTKQQAGGCCGPAASSCC